MLASLVRSLAGLSPSICSRPGLPTEAGPKLGAGGRGWWGHPPVRGEARILARPPEGPPRHLGRPTERAPGHPSFAARHRPTTLRGGPYITDTSPIHHRFGPIFKKRS